MNRPTPDAILRGWRAADGPETAGTTRRGRMPGGRAVAAAVLAAAMAAGFAMDTEFAAESLHEAAGSGLMVNPRGSTMKTRLKALRVAAVSASAVVSFAVTESAQAQQPEAVQWRVEDGGNGHWYQKDPTFRTWPAARATAAASGGHLATIRSLAENQFVFSLTTPPTPPQDRTCWLGGFQASGSCEPGCGWAWITGEPFDFQYWAPGEPNNSFGDELYLHIYVSDRWNDAGPPVGAESMIEWDADCNSDGIVDYGQCQDGTLPDYNGNNIPDCCEVELPCKVGSYPVQWRHEDGGNGHWYSGVNNETPIFWVEARELAVSSGGHLATPSSVDEDQFLVKTFLQSARLYRPDYSCCQGPYVGAFNDGSGWAWVDETPWIYSNWHPGNPNEIPFTVVVYWSRPECRWQDQNDSQEQYKATSYIVEWSADCNSDGIVDYGQILAGDLADANSNGIPDVCEVPSCIDADLNPNGIVDGADLGALLAFWGPVSPAFPRADINGDGNVNGADLGILLSLWGPCGG